MCTRQIVAWTVAMVEKLARRIVSISEAMFVQPQGKHQLQHSMQWKQDALSDIILKTR